MHTPDASKLKDADQNKLVSIFQLNDRLVQLRHEQAELQNKIKLYILQEYIKVNQLEMSADNIMSLQRAYHRAVQSQATQFVWQGHEFLTDYAKYLLEYIETTHAPRLCIDMRMKQARYEHKRIMRRIEENRNAT